LPRLPLTTSGFPDFLLLRQVIAACKSALGTSASERQYLRRQLSGLHVRREQRRKPRGIAARRRIAPNT
jgi:hypothetical protein